jgi:polyphosphate kinase 2 (PPK2 family)
MVVSDQALRLLSHVKLLFNISRDEQRARFLDRFNRPEKRWKLTLADLTNYEMWDDYQAAFVDMLDMTSMDYAPWTVVPANDKKYARIKALRTVSEALEAHIDPEDVLVLDPGVEKRIKKMFGKNNKNGNKNNKA